MAMIDRPNFKFSRRGYEPEEVDSFIESQNRTLQAAKKDASERSVELTKLNAQLADLRGQLGQQTRAMADLKKSAPSQAQTYTELGERGYQVRLGGHDAGGHAGDLAEEILHAPEAACAEQCRFHLFSSDLMPP